MSLRGVKRRGNPVLPPYVIPASSPVIPASSPVIPAKAGIHPSVIASPDLSGRGNLI